MQKWSSMPYVQQIIKKIGREIFFLSGSLRSAAKMHAKGTCDVHEHELYIKQAKNANLTQNE